MSFEKVWKTLNFGAVDHIKSVKRALSCRLKGHSKHNYIIRNRRYMRINRLDQLTCTGSRDAKVSFVNSFDKAFCFLLSSYVVMRFLSKKLGIDYHYYFMMVKKWKDTKLSALFQSQIPGQFAFHSFSSAFCSATFSNAILQNHEQYCPAYLNAGSTQWPFIKSKVILLPQFNNRSFKCDIYAGWLKRHYWVC